MMKLLKCKKQKSNITFYELTNRLNPTKDSYIRHVIKKLIIHYSNIIKNDVDIFFEKNTQIDFDYNIFIKSLEKVIYQNYPVEYITNKFEFYGIDFYIQKNVFVPRQETEFIVDWIIKSNILDKSNIITDLCSGSGVIANTISSLYPNKQIIGIEKYNTPYKVCLRNKKLLNTNANFYKKNIFKLNKDFYKKVDVIICNPPYIAYDDKTVDESTKYEPKQALYAKENGFYFYFEFFKKYWDLLKKNTQLIFEIGYNQKEGLEEFINKNIKPKKMLFIKDLDKNYRILYMVK